MFKRIKIKLYPTAKQKRVLDEHLNAFRFLYNLCLSYKSTLWSDYKINVSGYDMQKEILSIRSETPWLLKCKAECLREAGLSVDKSYQFFFKGYGFPRFKSKHGRQSFKANQSIRSKNQRLLFFKNKIKYKTSLSYVHLLETNKIKQCAFIRDTCGDYWATCLIEIPDLNPLVKINKSVGIDLGIKTLMVTSDGEYIPNKKYIINSQFKLRRWQRKLSKSQKDGNNRKKLRIKVAKIHRRCTRQKEHYYHQITNKIINDNQVIVLESLKIKNMMKNQSLALNIVDASWGLLKSMLEYKSSWYGRQIVNIGTFFPSSKMCSGCGNVKEKLLLSQRTYDCESCGLSLDRDLNAAINIRNEGLKIAGLPVEDTNNSLANEAGSKSIIINN